MAALNFPSSPTVGQVYTANGKSWQWDGVSWISYNTLIAAGSNTQIQFNNSGAFGASAGLTWNGTTLTTTGLNNTGSTTLGDAAGDTLTINAGTTTFAGTGQRITGDFSSATATNRVMFQSSTVNGGTSVGLIPNGTSTSTEFRLFSSNDTLNNSTMVLANNGAEVTVRSGISGTGTYLPMTFYTGGSERARIDTSGNVGIGTSSPNSRLGVFNSQADGAQTLANSGLLFGQTGGWAQAGMWPIGSAGFAGSLVFGTAPSGSGSFSVTERMRIDSSGNVGIGAAPGGKLDVTGADDTVVYFRNASALVRLRPYITGPGFSQISALNAAGNAYTQLNIGGSVTVLETGGTERMRIDSSGNVGIGLASATQKLDLFDATTVAAEIHTASYGVRVGANSTFGGYIGSPYADTTLISANQKRLVVTAAGNYEFKQNTGSGNNSVSFNTTTQNALTLNASGNFGIGTNSPVSRINIVGGALNSGGGTGLGISSGLSAGRFASGPGVVALASPTDASTVEISAGSTGGNSGIAFSGSGGDVPSSIRFYANAERMRIDASGNLNLGITGRPERLAVSGNSGPQALCLLYGNTAGDVGNSALVISKFDNNTTTSQVYVRFFVNALGTACGQINANGASTAAFGTYSDSRLKENIAQLPSQLTNICALNPSEFDYRDGSGHQIGFIAQEMQEVYPDVVSEGEDGMLMITGWSKTEARLVKAIQELHAEIETLKQRIH